MANQRYVKGTKAGIVFAATLLLFLGCSPLPVRDWPDLEGRVLDAQTGEPIEDAFVVVRWKGFGGHSQSQCFHVEVPETDVQGRYRIERWRNEQDSAYLSDQRRTIVRVHKTDYRESPITQERESYLQGVYYLEKDERGAAERLEYVVGTMRSVGCGGAGESQRRLYPLRASIYYEAKALGASPERLQWIREVAAGSAVATSHDVTGPERDQAIKEFLKENLR